MTNKTQTMLTIALTVAVSVLLVDRIIEPAQAQDCASPWDVMEVGTDVRNMATDLEILAMRVETVSLQLEAVQMMLE